MIRDGSNIIFSSPSFLNPDQYYLPSYRISPFCTQDIATNANLPSSTRFSEYLAQRFNGRKIEIVKHGKQAINLALSTLNLDRDDVVTILTTSGNLYVSGCVTREIEKFCKWSRSFEKKSKCILVIHEFGFPFSKLTELKEHGLPIIEDACHSFLSQNEESSVGKVGDFVVYSLPKMFPIQAGGLLVHNSLLNHKNSLIDENLRSYILKVTSTYAQDFEKVKTQRQNNYRYLEMKMAQLHCSPRFTIGPFHVPGVFMFKTPTSIDLGKLKTHCMAHGIECSVFYGENAFFIPVHQRLQQVDLDYFFLVIEYFFRSNAIVFKGS